MASGVRARIVYGYGHVELWPCIATASGVRTRIVYSYGHIELWPYILMASEVRTRIIYLWPYILMEIHSYGEWGAVRALYVVMAM